MAAPRAYNAPQSPSANPNPLSRMTSLASNRSFARHSSAPTSDSGGGGMSDNTSIQSESPRARYYPQLQELAALVGIPLALPKPILSTLDRRAVAQSASDKHGAEQYLMSLRPKKFLLGRSSKGFASDEALLGLDKAVKDQLDLPVIEALLQLEESSAAGTNAPSSAFTTNNKGQAIPSIDYIFGQTIALRTIDVSRLFLGRVSQHTRDNALAGALKFPQQSRGIIQALLEWGANPEQCRNQVLELISAGQEDVVESILLSPSVKDPEFLSQALTISTSLRITAMLLLRGADSNFNHGEALKMAILNQRYDLALAGLLMSQRPVSSRILDEVVPLIGSWSLDLHMPWLKMLLYAGASGPRTSKAIVLYIKTRDPEIVTVLFDTLAFMHGSFPANLLFQSAVEAQDTSLALNVLRSSKNRSFSDYASTGVHLQLIDGYGTKPDETLDILVELLTLGASGDVTSQMLTRCCEAEHIHTPRIIALIDLLIRTGAAKASYADGRCVMLSIENGEPAILKALIPARPTKKILSTAIEHANTHLEHSNPTKLEVWSILLEAGATGPVVDRQLVMAIDGTPQAIPKVKLLLPNASLDFDEGAAIMKAIRLNRLDILGMCLETKIPHASLPSIWKQTRLVYAENDNGLYSLEIMQSVFEALYKASKSAVPLDDLLHDATQCPSKGISLALSTIFIRWGASPNHALGAPLVACIKRCDTRTLAALLLQSPSKISLKYAFEEALVLRASTRHESIRLIIDAGLETSCLDAALPRVLEEDPYESSIVHLMVQKGARLHSSWGKLLTRPTLELDLETVEILARGGADENTTLTPLKALLSSRSDWLTPDGLSLPMVKFLLANSPKGVWADRIFVIQAKELNEHATNLFLSHLTSSRVLNDALHEVLSFDEDDLSDKKLSMVNYLLNCGAVGEIVDAVFFRATQELNHEWVVALSPHLRNATTKNRAFEVLSTDKKSDQSLSAREVGIKHFLLAQGVRGHAVDEAFITSAVATDLKGTHDYLQFISSPETLSQALNAVAKTHGFTSTNDGLAVIKLLIRNGASGPSVLNAARASAKAHSMAGVDLILRMSDDPLAYKSAFRGLLDNENPLSSSESRAILRYLMNNGVDGEDAKSVARLAVEAFDLELMNDIAPENNSKELVDFALSAVATTQTRWISTRGLPFVEFLLKRGARGTSLTEMIETACRSRHLSALRLLLRASDNQTQAANTAFTTLMSDKESLSCSEGLSVLNLLLQEGAMGTAVERAAAYAAEHSNYDALDIFLRSPIAASIIPAAFKAVARDRSKHLSSDQLSIASILVKHGVSTEILAIAAVEAAKMLDLEALEMLSRSPRFQGVADETLRTLLLDQDHNLWSSPKGLRIMQFLFETGVSLKSKETAASKAAAMLEFDALKIVLDADDSSEIVEAAFTSMTGLNSGWLLPEGLRIAEYLIQKGPSQAIMDKAFLQACQSLHLEAVQLFFSRITNSSVFNTAFAMATSDESRWFSEQQLIDQLLHAGIEGVVVESALIKSAQALNYNAIELLSSNVKRWEAFTKAFAAALTNELWRESLDVMEFLLDHGATGDPVDNGYVSAAGSLDYAAVSLLSGYVDKPNVDTLAFSAMTNNPDWLLPIHLNLLAFLYDRGVASDVVEPALVFAASSLNLAAVELLAGNATQKMVSAAFKSATGDGCDWGSNDGTSILQILAQKGAKGEAVNKTLIQSAQQLRLDLVDALHKNVDKGNDQCFLTAFDGMIATGDLWQSCPEALDIFDILLSKGAVPESASIALVKAAQAGDQDAVSILSQVVEDPVVYAEAFIAFVEGGQAWLQDESHNFVTFLLTRTAPNYGLHSALIRAVEGAITGEASLDLVNLLLEHGADVNYNNGEALQVAVQDGITQLASLLPQYNASELTLYMGLQKALRSDHDEEVVLELFSSMVGASEAKPDVNHDSELGSPLIFYCLNNYPLSFNLAKEICDLGADLGYAIEWQVYEDEQNYEAPASDLIPALPFALLHQASDEVIESILLAYGADHTYIPTQSMASALILASKLDRHYILTKLIDLGARVAQKDCFDRTALFYAGRNGNVASLTSLLKKKPPINDGSLHEAARELHSEAVKILVAAGHDVNFPSFRHNGRNPLCELCYRCKGSEDPVRLQETLSELMARKAAPLRKCRERTALFYAMENENPIQVVSRLIDTCLWKDLNDQTNVFQQGDYFYSATMYIKKGITYQPEVVALNILQLLQDVNTEDRYYAKERMPQPSDAEGMPQRILDLDRKKWLRSNRLEEEDEDHQRRLRREVEEMNQRDQLTTQRHLLTMEQREDLALQTTTHNADAHWQGRQFRSMDHEQTMRYRDQLADQRLNELAMAHRLKYGVEQQNRSTQLAHESQANIQRLSFLDKEQGLRLGGAQAQQQLKIGGISMENELKNEQEKKGLEFRAARGALENDEMDNRLRHMTALNAERTSTQDRMENIARESQHRKNILDQQARMSQLEYQGSSDDQKLRTEGAMSQYRRDNNDDQLRTRNALLEMSDMDRQNQLRFSMTSDQQKLQTLQSQGMIQNHTSAEKHRIEIGSMRERSRIELDTSRSKNRLLQEKGAIENQTLNDRHYLLQDNRNNELQHTAQMGHQRITNERGLGQQRVLNERNMGAQKMHNELGMGRVKVLNERNLGEQKIQNEIGMGNARAMSEQQVGQVKNTMNRQRLIDNARGAQAQAYIKQAGRGGGGGHQRMLQ